MGIVYRARHRKLDRDVALKMILAGAHASSDQLQRFVLEARAVAHLQHPNIVQIFEVGEQEGLPYFSLEYVDGQRLDKLVRGKTLPHIDAATIIETLARVMHYAHEHGVLHRDLKPANVLLTKSGIPKVTDFGLAKRLQDVGDSASTRTGTIMGTPSYMSPEQASGNVRELGPATDQYSLGAMLYEFLTGRPPFLAASRNLCLSSMPDSTFDFAFLLGLRAKTSVDWLLACSTPTSFGRQTPCLDHKSLATTCDHNSARNNQSGKADVFL